MKAKPGQNRRLPAYDEQQIEELLIREYRGMEIQGIQYSYPLNDAQLLVEYLIKLFNQGDEIRFFRKAFKRNGQWFLSADFSTLKQERGGDAQAEEIIKVYMKS